MSTAVLVARNTIANWVGLATSTVILLLLTPYLVGSLGNERFGLYAIANQTLTYVYLLTLGMQGAVTRFASRDIAASDSEALNTTMSAICFFYGVIGTLGLVVCGVLGVLSSAFFGVSAPFVVETKVLFAGIGPTFVLGLFSQLYGGVLIGHQRYDLYNVGSILRDLGRALFIVALFMSGWTSLSALACALIIAHVLPVLYYRRACLRQHPGLRVDPTRTCRAALRQLLGFGLWNTLIQVGNVLTFATPPFVVAKLLGTEQVVYYAVPAMMADRLFVVVSGMANTLSPMAAATLVTGDRRHFQSLIIQGTLVAATIALPLGAVLLVFCKSFLILWLGTDYAGAAWIYAVLMVGMFGRLTQAPTMRVLLGGGRIRGLAYIQTGLALGSVCLSIYAAWWTTWGVVGVAAGVSLPLLISHSILVPWYAARQMNVSIRRYAREAYLWPVLSTLPGVGAGVALQYLWPPNTWSRLVVEVLVSLSLIAVPAWYTCLEAGVRRRLLGSLRC